MLMPAKTWYILKNSFQMRMRESINLNQILFPEF